MKTIVFKRFFATHQEIWFYEGAPVDELYKNIYYQSSIQPPGHAISVKKFHTLATHLSCEESIMYSKINRTFRYDIKKGEALKPDYIVLDLQDKHQLLTYLNTYNYFAREKKLLTLPVWRLRALADSGGLLVTVIKRNDQLIGTHAYLQDGIRARLLTSHTARGTMSGTQLGYCNKYHHWQDICYFKNLNFEWYDWGGVSVNPNDGRNNFKQSFGGEPQLFYHFITCKNWLRPWLRLYTACENTIKKTLLYIPSTRT